MSEEIMPDLEQQVENLFNENDNPQNTNDTPQEPVNKVKIGDAEYTQEEVDRLVGLGKIADEAEKKFNTKIDKVWPEYTRGQQELRTLKEEKAKAEEERNKVKLPENEEQAIREARDAAKKLGIVTDEDFEDRMGKVFTRYYQQERAAEKLLEDGEKLQREIDGSDGRPSFILKDVLEFMRDNMGGQGSMETAYKLMHEKELDGWREQQLAKNKRPGITTTANSGGGAKVPPQVKVTNDNLEELVADMFKEEQG